MGTINIIVIDDDEAIREATVMLLELLGHTATCYENITALDKAGPVAPDLYLVDHNLGDENGLIMCTRIKGNPSLNHIRVVIMSASPEARLLIDDHGCDAFLAKPFTRKSLQAVVEKVFSPA